MGNTKSARGGASDAPTTNRSISKKSRSSDPWEAFWGPLVSPSYMRWDLAQASDDQFLPAVDIHEDDKCIRLDLELAGIPKEDIHVEVADGVLTVSGEKKYQRDHEEQGGKVHRVERRYGSFKRSVVLPETADQDSIDAKTANGVLHITVSKKQLQPSSKKIDIQ